MRKLLILPLVLLCLQSTQGQTWDEWFKQKKTQRKYLLQQIAALKVYYDYAKKGYEIASQGLHVIRNIKNGDFNLHRDFFGSLEAVNPKIKNYARVADIIHYQVRILKESRQTIEGIRQSGQLTAIEIDYCQSVFDLVLNESLQNLDELILLITSGELEMKDNERLNRIDGLYADMQDRYTFTASFSADLALLAAHRMRAQYEIDLSGQIFGLE